MRAIAQIIIACLLVLFLGMHWALLQTVAWTGMIISYAQRASLEEAVSKTFDGKHPCALCKAIQKGRAEEQKRDDKKLNSSLKLDFAVIWQGTYLTFASGRQVIHSPDINAPARQEEPPKPRPRLA